jgi:hypothetical protein
MPSYRLTQAKGHAYGLNQKTRSTELAPGEAVVAQNVEYDNDSVKKVKGCANVCRGDVDGVFKGGAPPSWLYLQGDPWWVEHPEVDAARQALLQTGASLGNFFRSPFHARQGVVMIPEGAAQNPLALDVQSTDEWGVELNLWSDDVHFQPVDPASTTKPYQRITVLSKGWSVWSGEGNYQWRIVLKPVDASTVTGDVTFYIALEIWDSVNFTTAPSEFTLAANAAIFYPGERFWVAWTFDPDAGANGEITSWYRRLNAAVPSTQSSTTAVGATLAANGNIGAGNDGCPIMVGGQVAHGAGANPPETFDIGSPGRNFNGVVGELRFYDESVANAAPFPTWDDLYAYYDREFNAAEFLASGLKDTVDLKMVFTFALDQIVSGRFILPRYSTASPLNNGAWLTGADAQWVSSPSTKLGDTALAFMPSGPNFSEQNAAFYRGLVAQALDAAAGHNTLGVSGDLGPEMFAGGIRVPNGNQYLANKGDGATATGPEFRDGMSAAVAFTTYDVNSDNITTRVLLTLCTARHGAADNYDYEVTPIFQLRIAASGGNWRLSGRVRDSAGTLRNVLGTTNLAANTDYVGVVTCSFDSGNYNIHLYLNGTSEGSATGANGKPPMSQATSSAATGDNKNDDDGRDLCFPMMIGCSPSVIDAFPPRNDKFFMFGAESTVGADDSAGGAAAARRYWAFHRNFSSIGDVKKTPNAGVAYRGFQAHRGTIGWIGIWAKMLTQSEVLRISEMPPSDQDARGYGQDLLSLWLFNEGSGSICYDKGSLGNNLRIHEESQVRGVAGPFGRESAKGQLLQLAEYRSRTPREGSPRRELYALSEGSLLRLVDDGAGEKTWESISSHQFTDTSRLGSVFRYADFVYWCPGSGPVLRISNNRVTSAGIAPPFSSLQNDFKGWQEGDRDGTFQILQGASSPANFEQNGTWLYAVTFYDPESGTESPPSRSCLWKVNGNDAESLTLFALPRPHDKHVRKYRIYRSSKNGGQLLFLDEVNIQAYYVDSKPDAELGIPLTAQQNFPPPQDANIGIQWGARAAYAGSPESPATLFVSKESFPEACPFEYRLTLVSGKSAEITGMHVMQGRLVVFLQDTVFQVTDAGGDIGVGGLVQQPLNLKQIGDQTGCVGHQTLEWIDQVGLVFAGERGLYVTGDGVSSTYIGERVEPFWAGLDKTSWRTWHAVHWRNRHQYIMFCSDGAVAGRNNLALVWDYKRNAFSTRTGIEARHSQVIEDENTGVDRLYVTDYLGQMWELDTDDDNYGATIAGATSGTVQAGATATIIPLVSDSSLPVTADGLRGVELLINSERVRIASNTANSVTLEGPLLAVPAENDPWKLGSIAAEYKLGKLDYQAPTRLKQTPWVELSLEANSGSLVEVTASLDDRAEQRFVDEDAGKDHGRVGPIMGRHNEIQVGVKDDLPDNPWEVKDILFAHHLKGRTSW